jgi:hypothetical protein
MSNIEQLVKDAVARFNALSLAEQKAARAAQRKSWVVGEMMWAHPEMTRKQAERIYDQVCP